MCVHGECTVYDGFSIATTEIKYFHVKAVKFFDNVNKQSSTQSLGFAYLMLS